ncbi:hypothetical protein ACQ4M3_06140 [Leptolyngbya sp. AN03gr2]|uniref:hypothetical protein n=1 Tax=unclassified Leptolyngbya TaxID=2650499 RepID=UPI003D3150B9
MIDTAMDFQRRELDRLQQSGLLMFHSFFRSIWRYSQRTIDKLVHRPKEMISELTEDTIAIAVDQAIHVLEVAGQQVREREIPTENVQLEVGVEIAGVIKLNIKAAVPKSGELQNVVVNVDRHA